MAGVGFTSGGIAALMPYYNEIMSAVERYGWDTRQAWNAYKNGLARTGQDPGGATIADMNYMMQNARSVLTGEQNFAGAPGYAAIDSSMWAWAPWAAGETDAWAQDRYQVRYQATLTGPNGEITPVWGVTDWEGSLEGLSVDQMVARAYESAQNSLDTGSPGVQAQLGMIEGFSLSSVDRVQIMRV